VSEPLGWIAWSDGEPCPICGEPFARPDIPHLLAHPEAMEELCPMSDKEETE
jgi:hypothetical protein